MFLALVSTTGCNSCARRAETQTQQGLAENGLSPTEFHMTSSASQQIYVQNLKGTTVLAMQWRHTRFNQESVAQRRCIKTRNADLRLKVRFLCVRQTP